MPQCAVATCRNSHRKTKGRRVRYHRFPAEADVRSRWVSVCGRGAPTFNTATARVCSLHFSPGSYERDVEHELLGLPPRSRLRRGAVPDRAVPVSLPSLIGTKHRGGGGGQQVRGGRKAAPPRLRYEYEPVEPNRIDVLLALGLTPTANVRQDGGDPRAGCDLNKMHIMDDDCSSKPAVLDESPKTNGSPKTCARPLPVDGERDSDSGKVNGAVAKADGHLASPEGAPGDKPEQGPGREDEKKDVQSELQTSVPAVSTPSAVKESEDDRDIGDAESPSSSGGEEGKLPAENTGCSDGGVEQEDNKTEQDFLKSDENCSLPPSPPEEEDNSGATSPASQRGEPKRSPDRRKRNSSDSDSDTPSVIKKMKLMNADFEERERSVSEYVESAAGTSLEEIQRHTDKLQQEIHTLSALARAKEREWNNIIRVKKIKEEMYIRLQRKRQVMLLMMGPAGKLGDAMDWDLSSDMRFGECSGPEDIPYEKTKITGTNCKRMSKATGHKSNLKGHNNMPQLHQQPSSTGSVLKNGQNQLPVMMVPVVSSSPGHHSASNPVSSSSQSATNTTLTRVSESNRDKLAGRTHRPILPKPTIIIPSGNGSNSNNGQNPVIGEGRQGPILDVRSIIADYRSKHPGDVPRRGRRLKSALSPNPNSQVPENLVSSTRVSGAGGILSMASLALGSGSQMRPGLVGSTSTDMPDLGFLLNSAEGRHDSSRPSSADSSRSGAPSQTAPESGNIGTVGGISFKDVLVQFAKLSQNEQRHEPLPTTTTANKAPPYPEVTLHPVLAPHSPPHQSPSSSLLHGILTKSASMQQHRNDNASARPTTFSPTLARLLTAPERMPGSVTNTTVTPFHGSAGPVSISDLLSTSKQTRNEITITPVAAQQPIKAKEEVVLLEEEQEDSADRLVIDESGDGDARGRGDADDDQGVVQEMSPEDVPECQGCHQRAAQFVCAGCGNQWYCSRDCQVSAWDDHSEVCSG